VNGFLKDFQFALRQLYARPGFTAIAVIVLALGLGATAAIFSIVHAVLLQPLPYPNPKTLVRVFESDVIGNAPEDAFNVVSPGLFQEWQKDAHALSTMAAVNETSFNISSESGSFIPEHINGLACSSTFLEILDVQPILGRFFNRSEDQFEAPYVAVLSYRFWQQRFGGVPNVVGRQIRLTETTTRFWAYFRRILRIRVYRPMYLCHSSEPWASIIGPPSAITFSMSLAVWRPGTRWRRLNKN